tara:strand:- start:771 stop:1373 length:603 start_codon:yes stop_codon:yes gene_type:complete
MFTPLIKLSEREMLVGASSGIQREVECLRSSGGGENAISNYERKNNSIGPGGLWNNHVEGALGEIAVAKYLGMYPGGITDAKATDVGDHYEVRTRPYSYYELFVRKREKKDKEDKYFILAQGSYGEYTIRGWITAYEVFVHPEWYHNNENKTGYRYWVPHEFLYPILDLPKEAPCQEKIISSLSLSRSIKPIQPDLFVKS